MVSQVLMIGYMIRFRPFKSELQQVIAVSDEFILVFSIILIYFLWQNQDNLEKSNKIGMGIISTIVISLIKNMGVIIYVSMISMYRKFRAYMHKRLGMEKYLRRQRRIERRKRRENLKQVQEEKELINKIFIGKLRPDQIMAPGKQSIINNMRKVERPKPELQEVKIPEAPKYPINIINDQLVPGHKPLKPRFNSASGSQRNKFRRKIALADHFREAVSKLETIHEEEELSHAKSPTKIPRNRSR